MVKGLLQCPCFLLLAATCVFADEDATSVSGETDASAARLMAAVRVIEGEHFDPPPRQELVHRLMRRLAARFHSSPPPGLGRELSALTDDVQLEVALTEFCRGLIERKPTNTDAPPLEAVEQEVLQDLLNSLLGPNVVRTRKQHVVDEQFASNQYVGIGIALSLNDKVRVAQMHKVFEGGPVDKAGAEEGDLILEINGESTAGMQIEDVVDRLRGPAGSDVTLLLQQPSEPETRELTITRGVVPLKNSSFRPNDGSMAIVISKVTAATVQELREIEVQLEDSSEEVVLHINSGGEFDLHHAVLLADALLDGGEIGRVRTTSGVREFTASRDCLFRNRPLKVQVSDATSGPVEWIVAALQDNGRAMIVGQQTAGRPFITQAYEVPGTDWVLKLTYGVLERADGRRLLRTESSSSGPLSRRRIVRRSDGRQRSAVIRRGGSPDHDGGIVPDEVVDIGPPPTQISPVEPPTEGVKWLLKRFFGGRSNPE